MRKGRTVPATGVSGIRSFAGDYITFLSCSRKWNGWSAIFILFLTLFLLRVFFFGLRMFQFWIPLADLNRAHSIGRTERATSTGQRTAAITTKSDAWRNTGQNPRNERICNNRATMPNNPAHPCQITRASSPRHNNLIRLFDSLSRSTCFFFTRRGFSTRGGQIGILGGQYLVPSNDGLGKGVPAYCYVSE